MTNPTTANSKRRTALAAAVMLALIAFSPPTAAQTGPTLSKQELKTLVMNAKSRADHQRVSEHYRAEADRLEGEAKDHAEMAQMYARNPGPEGQKNPLAYRTKAHCDVIAARYREAAKRMLALAEVHAEMARKAAQ